VALVELASRAEKLYTEADMADKRRLIETVVYSARLNSGKLTISYHPPFDLLLAASHATSGSPEFR
jgi:hypothetical protein